MELAPLPLWQIPLEDLMETQPLTVQSGTPLIDAVALMSKPREERVREGEKYPLRPQKILKG